MKKNSKKKLSNAVPMSAGELAGVSGGAVFIPFVPASSLDTLQARVRLLDLSRLSAGRFGWALGTKG